MNQELIEQLKKNEKPFGLMSAELQEAAKEIGKKNFEYYQYSAGGFREFDVKEPSPGFIGDCVYRLRPEYEPCKCDMCNDRGTIKSTLPHDITYYGKECPCPQCQPESEIVEARIYGKQVKKYIKIKANAVQSHVLLSEAINDPDFIGFKFGSGAVMPFPVTSKVIEATGQPTDYKVLHATHVLFRRSK